MINYPYVLDLENSSKESSSGKSSFREIASKLGRYGAAKDPAAQFMWHLWNTNGDAALALHRYKDGLYRMDAVSRFIILTGNPPRSAMCLACKQVESAYRISNISASELMRSHVGFCSKWADLDEKASTLLFTDLTDLPVVIDNALEKGIL